MRRTIFIIGLLAFALAAHGADLAFPADVTAWQPVAVPTEAHRDARAALFRAANYSTYEWRVSADHGRIEAALDKPRDHSSPERPTFVARAGTFRDASSFARVDDGWLAGFNNGEWGGALYWFSNDGTRSYKISDHQVVQFFGLADGLFAIEGLAHLSMSSGSIVRISRPSPGMPWRAETFTKLPFAPYAVSLGKDNVLLVTLSDALVSIDLHGKITTLSANPPWRGLYPNSSAVSPDGRKLYIGMRQFVEEFDLQTMSCLLYTSPSPRDS